MKTIKNYLPSTMTSILNKEGTCNFEIRIIEWSRYKTKSPILMENESGQCLLISLINSLVLDHDHAFDYWIITMGNHKELVETIRELLLTKEKEQGFIGLNEITSHLSGLYWDFVGNFYDVVNNKNLLKTIPKLHTRFEMDPILYNGQFSWYEAPGQLCDVVDMGLYHGWCYGKDEAISDVIKSLGIEYFSEYQSYPFGSFNDIQKYLLKDTNDETAKENKSILSQWLNNNKTQLTNAGLQKLNDELEDETFVVFFLNNNFRTLYKKSEMDFYLLITNPSVNSDKVVWKSLNLVGDGLYFDGSFLPTLDIMNELPKL